MSRTPEAALARLYDSEGDREDLLLCAAALERARVVGVLDGWARDSGGTHWIDVWCGMLVCVLDPADRGDEFRYDGATEDEARSKAAAAIGRGEVRWLKT